MAGASEVMSHIGHKRLPVRPADSTPSVLRSKAIVVFDVCEDFRAASRLRKDGRGRPRQRGRSPSFTNFSARP